MLKKHRKKYVLQSKSIGKKVKHDPLQNKGKRRFSKQGVLRNIKQKYSTHLHISIKLHDQFLLGFGLWLNNIMRHKCVSLILPKALDTSHRIRKLRLV
jgi:hypothetical protein